MAKETTVGQRVSELIAQLDISKNAFAVSLEKTATVVQHLVDERNKPGFDLLCKIFEVYPNVSKDWLLLGAGPMLITVDLPATEAPTEPAAAEAPAPKSATPKAAATPEPAAAAEAPPTPPAPISATPEVAAPTTAPPAPATTSDAGWQSALYTQQMAHQLAMAEMRNQFLQDQQRMMQQMMDLMQRQINS